VPIVYTCKNCGIHHSKSQYSESRSCKKCGNLLLLQFVASTNNSENLPNNNFLREKTSQNEFLSTSIKYSSFKRAARNISNETIKHKEYTIFSEMELNKKPEIKEKQWWLLQIEQEKALNLKKKLLEKYRNKSLEQAIPGEIISNKQGKFYCIDSISNLEFKKIGYRECENKILSDLKILSGIGPKRELKLKKGGYSSIKDLENHPLWKRTASNFVDLIRRKDIGRLQSCLWKSLPKSHPLLHYLAGLNNAEDFAIVDIETLGLSERPIVLIGISTIKNEKVLTSQFLMRSISDEPGAIWAFITRIHKNSLISYNGRSFDIPYIQQRLAYYGIDYQINNPHFDLLHFTRRALGNKLENCRLETVEEHLKIGREINIPGALVPEFYRSYIETGNAGPLVAIVEHNKQDLLTLAALFLKLFEEWNN